MLREEGGVAIAYGSEVVCWQACSSGSEDGMDARFGRSESELVG